MFSIDAVHIGCVEQWSRTPPRAKDPRNTRSRLAVGCYERSPLQSWSCMPNRLHKLVLPWLLVCPPVWAERLPVPPGPPRSSSPVKAVQVPHRGPHSPTHPVLSRHTPTPPIPQANTWTAKQTPAPTPDRDAQPPPDQNSAPHTKVTPTDFRSPKVDADAGFPNGSRFRSPEDARPIQTPGFTLTIPLRLP